MTRRVPTAHDGGPVALLAAILEGTASLPDAACTVAPPGIFDAAAPGEPLVDVRYRHRAALGYCGRCDALDACRTWAQTQPADGMVRAGIPPTFRTIGRPKKAS